MKKSYLFLSGLSLLTLTSGVLLGVSINKQKQNTKEAKAYSVSSLPTTIDLNDNSASDIRSYYSSLNNLSTSERQGTNLLKNLKPILKNNQKYLSYDSTTSIWDVYCIVDRDWNKSPASSLPAAAGTYNSSTNKITNYNWGGNSSTYENPYLHALYYNRDQTPVAKAYGDHGNNSNTGINREHIWPKGAGFDTSGNGGARGDIMHLWAAHGHTNNKHSNYYYGYVDTTKTYKDEASDFSICAGNLLGSSKTLGGGTNVFEPQDSDKGDIARACFYMVARYNYLSGSDSDGIDSNNPNLELVNNITSFSSSGYTSSTSNTGKLGIIQDLLEWNRMDPPDEFEIHRNNLCYNNFTNNRNPFIDFPEWAEYIWGKSVNGSYNSSSTGYATPSSDSINDFGGGGIPVTPVSVTGVSVSPTNASLEVDGTQQLTVTVSPNNATDKSVTYSSNNTTVATVSNSGLITAKAAGNATITVTTTDGGYTATCAVTVTESVIPPTPSDGEVTIAYSDTFSPAFPTASGSVNSVSTEHLDSTSKISFYEQGIYKGDSSSYLMFAQNKGFLYNKTSLGTITSVTVSYTNASSTTGKIGVYFGSSLSDVSTYTTTNNATINTSNRYDTFTNNTSGNGFFQVSTSNKNVQVTSIVVEYISGSIPEPITLTGIITSGQTTTYNVGDTFSYDGTLTATYDDDSEKEVTPTSVSSPDMSTAGEKTITITYTEDEVTKECSYTITVNPVVNTTDTYELVSGDNPLLPGDQVIIAAQEGASSTYCYALKDTIYNSYYLTSNVVSVSDGEIEYNSEKMTVWTVGSTNSGYTFYNGSQYLYGSSSTSGGKTYRNLGLNNSIVAGTEWSITRNNENDGYDVISNSLYLEYYSDKFTTYTASNNSYPINFYKKVVTAYNFAQTLLDNITCDPDGTSYPSLGLTWNQLGALYNSISDTNEQYLLKHATYTVSGSLVTPTNGTNETIALAISKYDIIVGKYSYTDFINRKGTSAYGYASMPKNNQLIDNNSIIPMIIVFSSLATITGLGVFQYFKKKKEN